MKINLLQPSQRRTDLFSEKTLRKLALLGDFTANEGGADDCDIIKAIEGAEIAITAWGNNMLTKEALDAAPDLKMIIHAGGSVKPIMCEEVWERGIRVVGSQKAIGMGVAETALGLTVSASKNIFALNDGLHNGVKWAEGKENIRELYELTVGVISGGWVGRHYIKLLSNFDVDILLYDPFVTEEACERMGCRKADLETLLSSSDIISVHAPSLPETYHMFNADTLKLMKKEAVLINTSRGSLIDEDALYDHMIAGNLKYACLDVFEKEPLSLDSKLRTVPNIILTPHLAGLSQNGRRRIGAHVAEEIERYLNGEDPLCEIKYEMLSRMA